MLAEVANCFDRVRYRHRSRWRKLRPVPVVVEHHEVDDAVATRLRTLQQRARLSTRRLRALCPTLPTLLPMIRIIADELT